MWIDHVGVAHTISLQDPAWVMAEDFRRDLDRWLEARGDDVADLLEDAEARIFEDGLPGKVKAIDETAFERVPPAQALLQGQAPTLLALREAIERVDPRWRLDVILALTDYADSAVDPVHPMRRIYRAVRRAVRGS